MSMSMPCWIYRSSRKDEMYLYLARKDGFDEVPTSLMHLFGTPTLVMRIELSPQRPLAREDVHQVLENLTSRSYHLQMPPSPLPGQGTC